MFVESLACAGVFALGGSDHAGDGVGEAGGVVAGAEVGFQFLDEAEAFGVGESGVEAVADFDAHFSVLDEDEEDGAVVFVFEVGAPGLEDSVGVVFDAGVGSFFGVGGDCLGLGGFGAAEVEVHFWGFFGTFFGLEVGALFEAERGGVEHSGDALDLGVISLYPFIEAAAFDGDAVFGAFELRLE